MVTPELYKLSVSGTLTLQSLPKSVQLLHTTSHCVRTYDVLSVIFFYFCSASTGPYAGEGGANEPPSWAHYFKLMQFSPETEFTPLILALKSEFSYDSHPLCKNPLFRTPFFESLCTDLGYILSKYILL